MNLSHDGLSLWFGTEDAPAPPVRLSDVRKACLTVGLSPLNTANSVDVRYRVDGGPVRSLAAREVSTNFDRGIQYFRVQFPTELCGEQVEYCPVASCAGRQVPRPGTENQMLARFTLPSVAATQQAAVQQAAIQQATIQQQRASRGAPAPSRFDPALEWLGRVSVQLKPAVVIGQTPLGLRLDFYVEHGTISGGSLCARVHPNTADYLLVRPDGVAQIDVHGSLTTHDGAVLATAYGGVMELGADGYARMLSGNYPAFARIQLAPRFVTEDPRYLWLNRSQLLGVGQVNMRALVVDYDLFALGGKVGGSSAGVGSAA